MLVSQLLMEIYFRINRSTQASVFFICFSSVKAVELFSYQPKKQLKYLCSFKCLFIDVQLSIIQLHKAPHPYVIIHSFYKDELALADPHAAIELNCRVKLRAKCQMIKAISRERIQAALIPRSSEIPWWSTGSNPAAGSPQREHAEC